MAALHGYLLLLSTCVKVLLFPSYRSTDFEVHRNWLAITHTLELQHWYFEATSEWTLDYPPFFAYFEWLLSQLAARVDARVVAIDSLGYASDAAVAFQRASVIATELLLYLATWYYLCAPRGAPAHDDKNTQNTHVTVLALVLLNAGLLLVDHVHFQYNGLVIGLLVLCLALARDGRHVLCALAFSALVLLKHLFLTLAPVFSVYLLVHYCAVPGQFVVADAGKRTAGGRTTRARSALMLSTQVRAHASSSAPSPPQSTSTAPRPVRRFLFRLSLLAAIAASMLLLAFAPFYLAGQRHFKLTGEAHKAGPEQLKQILSRLFPFGRGLVHAYWAPNIWALYYFCDRLLAFAARRLGFCSPDPPASAASIPVNRYNRTPQDSDPAASATSGLVGEFPPLVLPAVTSTMSICLVLAALAPALYILLRSRRDSDLSGGAPSRSLLTRCVVYSSLCAFMLGYHVHEKVCLALVEAMLSFHVDFKHAGKMPNLPEL